MTKRKSRCPKPHKFMNKLLLNQWLISLFGIDPLQEYNGPAHSSTQMGNIAK